MVTLCDTPGALAATVIVYAPCPPVPLPDPVEAPPLMESPHPVNPRHNAPSTSRARHRSSDAAHPRLRHSTRQQASTAPAADLPLHGAGKPECALAAAVATVTWMVAVAPVPVIVTFGGLVAQVLPAGAPVQVKVICPADAPAGVSSS